MPGIPVTDQQVRVYMTDRRHYSQRSAAARAGFSERTARRLEADPRPPSQRKPDRGRTVPDPLEAVWETVLVPILERDPAVQAVTLLRHLQMTDPDAFPDDRVRRTLERRVRDWRALHGPERDVIFRQTPEPGRMALSDFTDTTELGVTVAGQPLAHRLFHFVLAYSGWEHAVRRRARTGGAAPAHRSGRRELHGLGRDPTKRTVDPGRRAARAPHRQPLRRLSQPRR